MLSIVIEVTDASGRHVGSSPVSIKTDVERRIQFPECDCPKSDFDDWFDGFGCRGSSAQIDGDLAPFSEVSGAQGNLCLRVFGLTHNVFVFRWTWTKPWVTLSVNSPQVRRRTVSAITSSATMSSTVDAMATMSGSKCLPTTFLVSFQGEETSIHQKLDFLQTVKKSCMKTRVRGGITRPGAPFLWCLFIKVVSITISFEID